MVRLNNGEAVVVVQNAEPDLYPQPTGPVFIRAIGNSYRVMPNPGLPPELCNPGPLLALAPVSAGMTMSYSLPGAYTGSGAVIYQHYRAGGIASTAGYEGKGPLIGYK